MNHQSFLTNPGRSTVIIVTVLFITGSFLYTVSLTDFFTQSFFKNSGLISYLLILSSFFVTLIVWRNYKLKQKT